MAYESAEMKWVNLIFVRQRTELTLPTKDAYKRCNVKLKLLVCTWGLGIIS